MSRKARKNVGVIGLGIIGTRVAAGLRAGGYQVFVWNRSAKPAPNFLGSPAEVADSAEILQIFVADAAALFEVIETMSETLTPRHVVICSATVGPEAVLEAAKIVQGRGAQFLDAPFTGSKLAAEKRQLVYYIGGSEATFLRVKPILEVTSKAIIRIGEIGHAATVKVVTNMIAAVTVQALAEALCIVQKAGLEPEVLAAAIEQNACRSGVIDLKLPKMMTGDYEPHFSLKHMFKDVQLGIHMANALDVEIPATTVTAGVMYGAINQGWGDADFSTVFRNYAPPEGADDFPALPAGAGEPINKISTTALRAIPRPEPAEGGEKNLAPDAPDVAGKVAGVTSLAPLIAAPVMVPPPVVSAAPGETNGSSEQKIEAGLSASDEPARAEVAPPEFATKSEEPAGEGEPAAPPINYVRRWFVARSGG